MNKPLAQSKFGFFSDGFNENNFNAGKKDICASKGKSMKMDKNNNSKKNRIAAPIETPMNYAAPNNHIFNLIFFWFFFLHQTLYKYAEVPHRKLMMGLCSIVLVITAIVIFDSWLVGVMYFY